MLGRFRCSAVLFGYPLLFITWCDRERRKTARIVVGDVSIDRFTFVAGDRPDCVGGLFDWDG